MALRISFNFPTVLWESSLVRNLLAQVRHAGVRPNQLVLEVTESAAMGDPEPAFGASRYMETLLRDRFAKTDFEVVNVAFTAINSHVILPLARECAGHEGDLWIIYMGNNEMVGPFGAATVFGAKAPPLLLEPRSGSAARSRRRLLGWASPSVRSSRAPSPRA